MATRNRRSVRMIFMAAAADETYGLTGTARSKVRHNEKRRAREQTELTRTGEIEPMKTKKVDR